MITQLRGTVVHKDPEFLVVDVNGVGYKVFVTPETLAHAPEAQAILLWTHLCVRENALDLYGFLGHDALSFFELLLGVSGVGPKSALGILGLEHVATLTEAISQGDTTYLTKVSGIGAKSAKKIVLELSDKIGEAKHPSTLKEDVDTLEALTAMGYSHTEAREALKSVDADVTGAHERLKHALKTLS